jgi:hemerythrin
VRLRWLNSVSAGVAEFNGDHNRMFQLLAKTAAALLEGKQERARALMGDLLAPAHDHTAREETFLRRIGFPGVENVIAVQNDGLPRIATLRTATPEDAGAPISSMKRRS